LRLPLAALLSPGYLPNLLTQAANANAFRVRQNTGSDMNVLVGSGTSKVDGYVLLGSVAGQGAYILRLDATTKTVAVPATDPTNPARYGVYAFIDDTAYSGTASRAYANVTCIRGTPAGSPTTPGPLAAWSAYVLLWEFQLAANATAVTNTILDAGIDQRKPARAAIAAGGRVADAQVTANQTGIGTSATDLTGLTVTFTNPGNRRYMISAILEMGPNTGPNSSFEVQLCTGASGGGTVLNKWFGDVVDGQNLSCSPWVIVSPAAGATSYHVRVAAGGGTLNLLASSTVPAILLVEDIGPA
jgi:hypothetical protein